MQSVTIITDVSLSVRQNMWFLSHFRQVFHEHRSNTFLNRWIRHNGLKILMMLFMNTKMLFPTFERSRGYADQNFAFIDKMSVILTRFCKKRISFNNNGFFYVF